MADITFGVVGDKNSYYPFKADETRNTRRGIVDIIRLPIGTHYNKFYKPFTHQVGTRESSDYTGDLRNDDPKLLLKPSGYDVFRVSHSGISRENNSSNSFNTDYGFRTSKFVYLSYLTHQTTNDSFYNRTFQDVNHKVKLLVEDQCIGISGMILMFNVDLPVLSRSIYNTSRYSDNEQKMWESLNARYVFRDKDTSDRVEIIVTDQFKDTAISVDTSDARIVVRMLVYEGNVESPILDVEKSIRYDRGNKTFSVANNKDEATGSYYTIIPEREDDPENSLIIDGVNVSEFRYDYDYSNRRYDRQLSDPELPRSASSSLRLLMGRLMTNVEFHYDANDDCSLYITGRYDNRSSTSTTFPKKNEFATYRLKLWEGDLGITLNSFDVNYEVQSDRRNITSGTSNVYPIEICTDYFKILYPNLYERFKVRYE